MNMPSDSTRKTLRTVLHKGAGGSERPETLCEDDQTMITDIQ